MQFLIYICALLTLCIACGDDTWDQRQTSDKNPSANTMESTDRLTNSYIVAVKPPGYNRYKSLYFSNFRREVTHYAAATASLFSEPGVKFTQHIASVDLKGKSPLQHKPVVSPPAALELQFQKTYDATPETAVLMRVDFTDPESAHSLLEKWQTFDRIWYAEPNYISQLHGEFTDYANEYGALTSGDAAKTHHDAINLVESFTAIDFNNPNPAHPIIAILDSGIDREHPALQGRVWENTSANVGKAGCKNDRYGCNTTTSFKDVLGDGNVYPSGLKGFGTGCPSDEKANCEHGTHVAGIAAGQVSQGVPGICPVCEILPVKIVGKIADTGQVGILDSSILAALKYISRFRTSTGDPGIRVVNASFGKFSRSKSVAVFIDLIYDQLGAIIIAASGNEDTNRLSYPASLEKVIAVSAVDSTDFSKTTFSNYGSWVDVSAPGNSIVSAAPGGSTTTSKSGTSMAAPFVAGLAGLVIASECQLNQSCSLPPDQIRAWILNAADPKIYDDTAFKKSYNPKITGNTARIPLLGRGIINAQDAINKEKNENQVTLYEDFSRVPDFCGTIHYRSGQGYSLWILLLLPLLMGLLNLKPSDSD